MSLVNQSIDALTTEILRRNVIAILLKKSFGIHMSSTTSAMIEYMSFIEARNPEFPRRILLVATGHADKYILNAFLADFRILGTMSPNVHLL
jgi:hypothetical protein